MYADQVQSTKQTISDVFHPGPNGKTQANTTTNARGFAYFEPSGPLAPYVKAAAPVIAAVGQALDVAEPYIERGIEAAVKGWNALKPYDPEAFLPVLLGLLMVFYGGQFPLIAASIEAFRITGWARTKASLIMLWESYKQAKAASDKDDLLDDNRDGIADVKQIGAHQLISRKLQVFARSTDPAKVNQGVEGLSQGLVAVVATLRLQFAQSIALGMSLADIFTQAAEHTLRPIIEEVTPMEYRKWISMGISYTGRTVAVTIVWWLQRIMSALHSSLRGAQILLIGLTSLAQRFKFPFPKDFGPSHSLFPVLCSVIGSIGFIFQINTGFRLFFPLNILAFPLRVAEWTLRFYLTYGPR